MKATGAEQGATANEPTCHGSCSKQHAPRQVGSSLSFNVRQLHQSMTEPLSLSNRSVKFWHKQLPTWIVAILLLMLLFLGTLIQYISIRMVYLGPIGPYQEGQFITVVVMGPLIATVSCLCIKKYRRIRSILLGAVYAECFVLILKIISLVGNHTK